MQHSRGQRSWYQGRDQGRIIILCVSFWAWSLYIFCQVDLRQVYIRFWSMNNFPLFNGSIGELIGFSGIGVYEVVLVRSAFSLLRKIPVEIWLVYGF